MAGPIIDATLAALLAEVDEATAKQESANARLRAYLVICAAPPAGDRAGPFVWPLSPSHPELLSTSKAAERAGRSNSTIERWCEHEGIGKKYGDRWRVSVSLLSAKIAPRSE